MGIDILPPSDDRVCDLHASQPSKGVRRYDRLARTYQVTFCSYTVFKASDSVEAPTQSAYPYG
jgi:hypothetical protein